MHCREPQILLLSNLWEFRLPDMLLVLPEPHVNISYALACRQNLSHVKQSVTLEMRPDRILLGTSTCQDLLAAQRIVPYWQDATANLQ